MNAPTEIKESIGGASRYQYRNGSDSPAIMGASPWAGWVQVRDAILGVSTFKGNIATAHGEKHEAAALAAARKFFQIEGREQFRLINGDYAATLDFFADSGETIIEIKCPYQGKKSKIWRSVNDYADPSYYVWQLHHQMMVAPTSKQAILFVYDAESGEFCWCETMRSQNHMDALTAEWDKFYQWMATDSPDPHDGWIQASEIWCQKARQYREAVEKMKDAELLVDQLKSELLALGEGDKVKGSGLTLVKSVRQGNVNYKAIPELKGINLDAYRGASTEIWTLKESK